MKHEKLSFFFSFPRARVGMSCRRASVPRRRVVAQGIPTRARGNEKTILIQNSLKPQVIIGEFSLKLERIDVYSLSQMESHLTRETCDFFSQAASVCLSSQNHSQGVLLKVEGELSSQFELFWKPVTPQMRDSCYDMQYTTEIGAYCLGILIMQKLTPYKVIRQSQKGTGFDFWLGHQGEKYPYQNRAQLEISGILNGTKSYLTQRTKEKLEQTKQSNHLRLPAYVVVVEFGTPILQQCH